MAGCDEAGRGPLAGPVVAAAVILPEESSSHLYLDSKKLSEKKRVYLAQQLRDCGAIIGIGSASPEEIDEINILQASLLSMRRAIEAIPAEYQPQYLLVDGKFCIPLALPQTSLVHGESKSGSIAAASIIAKTVRDKMMDEMHHQYPCYNFLRHKGYPTAEHKAAVQKYGPSPVHRRTFRGAGSK